MRVIPDRKASTPTTKRVITTASPEFNTLGAVLSGWGGGGASVWDSANDPVAYPFVLREAMIVQKLGWVNGSSAGGGVDVGIYSQAWARLVSTGAQTGSGNTAWQWIDVTDTPLAAGRYYLVCSRDNVTANRAHRWGNAMGAPLLSLHGVQDSATDAYPLPDPLTNMAAAATFTKVYVLGIQAQSVAAF